MGVVPRSAQLDTSLGMKCFDRGTRPGNLAAVTAATIKNGSSGCTVVEDALRDLINQRHPKRVYWMRRWPLGAR